MSEDKKPKEAKEGEATTDGELSDEDLAAVAGGLLMPPIIVATPTLSTSLTTPTQLTSTPLTNFNPNLLKK